MSTKPKIYIASPLGFSEIGRDFMYGKIIPIIEEIGFEILDTWKLTPDEILEKAIKMPYGKEKRDKWQELNKIIGKNNIEAIKSCSCIFAILDGSDVDSGTASEIGYACALGKPILGYRNDFRLSADNEGSTINLQVEYFIRKSGGKIIKEIKYLKEELKTLFKT